MNNPKAIYGSRCMPYDPEDYVSDESFDAMDLLELDNRHGRLIAANAQNARQNGQSTDPQPSASKDTDAGVGQKAPMDCVICLDDMSSKNISSTPCGHLFCTLCITQAVQSSKLCPLCKKPIQLNTLRRIFLPV